MKLNDFIDGLLILKKYYNEDGYHIGANQDQFYVYRTDYPLSSEDVDSLIDLGWFQPNTIDHDPNIDWAEYDSNLGWSVFI